MFEPQLQSEDGIAAELSGDERRRLLADDRRRAVLDRLSERTSPVDLDTLASDMTTSANGAGAADGDVVGRMKLTLHHVHLPKMAQLGVLEYEPSERVVRF